MYNISFISGKINLFNYAFKNLQNINIWVKPIISIYIWIAQDYNKDFLELIFFIYVSKCFTFSTFKSFYFVTSIIMRYYQWVAQDLAYKSSLCFSWCIFYYYSENSIKLDLRFLALTNCFSSVLFPCNYLNGLAAGCFPWKPEMLVKFLL